MSLKLKFDPKTIEHLGVKMYSTLPPALAELISNAYDADSSEVKIEFVERNGTPVAITIYDNGDGMSLDDIQNKFLVIGRNRRHLEGDSPSKKFGRLPTGKKGLGKLALFGLAKEITVDTVQSGYRNRFKLNWEQLLASNDVYNPEIEINNEKTNRPDGTVIQLATLKRRSPFDLDSLADSLARIFIVDSRFQISLVGPTGKRVSIRNDRRLAGIEKQFEWTTDDLIGKEDEYHGKITLNLVTALTPIPPSSGLRGIALFSRGKLVNAPEYFSDSTSSHFYQYLTGTITVDFIDLLDEDVISTNRQALNWDHPDMQTLRTYLSVLVSRVGSDWRKKRAEKKDKEIEQQTGINKEHWFSTLPKDVRGSVESIVKKMGESDEVSETFAPVVRALYNIVPEYPMLHWRHLNQNIKDGVFEYYKNQQYGLAADQGAKLYGQKIRDLTGLDIDGVDLATTFGFHYDKPTKKVTKEPTLKLNDLSTESFRNIQDGQQSLTRGLMQAFRNPVGHAPINQVVPTLISELDCLNVLSLVSYLTNKLDESQSNKQTEGLKSN